MGGCGSTLMKPCMSETDVRYDANYPKTIVETDPRWEKLAGFFRVDVTSVDPSEGGLQTPKPYNAIPGMPMSQHSPFFSYPFEHGNVVAFYNHTVDGSRLIANRYYFRDKAPEYFCNSTPPEMNAPPGFVCGTNGIVQFAGVYAALNHDNDKTLSVARATGSYAVSGPTFDPGAGSGSGVKLADGDTFEFTFNVKDVFSSVQSIVFFDDDNAALSAVHTSIPRKKITSANTAVIVRLTEDEFKEGIAEYNELYNVPKAYQVPIMTSDEVPGLNGTFPTEAEWCGGLVDDVSCTPSPYVEPSAQMKGGFVAMFVILGALVFGAAAYLLHRKVSNNQKRRYKEHVVRGIARNITIADSAGQVSPEELKKEFDHIDSDGGGAISKDELKKFVASGKVGTISDKDFEALWHAIDIDNSGEVDFVEFLTFLGSCGAEFDTVNKEQRAMSKEDKLKYASQRLSTRVLQVPPAKDEENEGTKDAEEQARMEQ